MSRLVALRYTMTEYWADTGIWAVITRIPYGMREYNILEVKHGYSVNKLMMGLKWNKQANQRNNMPHSSRENKAVKLHEM